MSVCVCVSTGRSVSGGVRVHRDLHRFFFLWAFLVYDNRTLRLSVYRRQRRGHRTHTAAAAAAAVILFYSASRTEKTVYI